MTMICDIIVWYFSYTYSCIVSPKEKKKNINNNLVVLPSHNKYGYFQYKGTIICKTINSLFVRVNSLRTLLGAWLHS